MSEDMLREVVRELPGLLQDFLKKVFGEKGKEWLDAFKRFLRKENPWPKTIGSKPATQTPRLLKFVKSIELPAIGEFSPKDYFKVIPQEDRGTADVIIGYIHPNLQSLLYSAGIEPAKNAETLRIRCLLVPSVDGPILANLGKKAKTTFGRMWQMMEKQGRGQEGDLLVNGCANIFYIEGTAWAVFCYWLASGGDWDVGADPVTYPGRWSDGRHVVSR